MFRGGYAAVHDGPVRTQAEGSCAGDVAVRGERGAQRAPGTHRAADAASREILQYGSGAVHGARVIRLGEVSAFPPAL